MNGTANGFVGERAGNVIEQTIEAGERGAKDAVASIRGKGRELARRVDAEIHERPFVGLAACTGAGFLLGWLFGARPRRLILAAGLGYLIWQLPAPKWLSELTSGKR